MEQRRSSTCNGQLVAGLPLDTDECWKAILARDASWDGRFVYGVLSTGVYCRPSCPSRRPLQRNMRVFRTAEEAEQAGLRPCRRCQGAMAELARERLERVCNYIRSHASEPLPLETLAKQAGLSRFHFVRAFKAALGVTPAQYVEACRLNALKGELRKGGSITDAIYESGFGSSSRLYERVDTRLGMTPSEYRARGAGVPITYVTVQTAVGRLLIAATDRGICSLQFGEDDAALIESLRREYSAATLRAMEPPYPAAFQLWFDELNRHLAGRQQTLNLPVDVEATAFQMQVWRYLQSIPYGSVQSYREVAAGIGRPSAARAVARACAQNRLALLVPCHRVIRGTGEVGGYRWGVDRKRALLEHERHAAAAQTAN